MKLIDIKLTSRSTKSNIISQNVIFNSLYFTVKQYNYGSIVQYCMINNKSSHLYEVWSNPFLHVGFNNVSFIESHISTIIQRIILIWWLYNRSDSELRELVLCAKYLSLDLLDVHLLFRNIKGHKQYIHFWTFQKFWVHLLSHRHVKLHKDF